jgi:hypothetical protein
VNRLRLLWLQFRIDWLAGTVAAHLRIVRDADRLRERLIVRVEEIRQRIDRERTRRVIAEAIARRPLAGFSDIE